MRLQLAALSMLLLGCSEQTPPRETSQQPDVAETSDSAATAIHTVVVEAESFLRASGSFVVAEDPDASGQACLAIAPLGAEQAELSGEASFSFDLPRAAEVSIWFRTRWGGTCANSFHLQAPVGPLQLIGEDGTFNSWHWVKGPRLPLPAGPNSFTLLPRESDIRVDQVLLTVDEELVPMGIEQ